jgi:hypothetical protein
MWEWFLPSSDRDNYRLAIMEGTGGGGGPLEPKVVGWMYGFLFGTGLTLLGIGIIWVIR